jgi:hypothetical protein
VNRAAVALLLGVVMLGEVAYLMGSRAYALAAAPDEPTPTTPTPYVAVMTTASAEETPRLTPSPRGTTPEPTATPGMAPATSFDQGEFRCIARYAHSSVPRRATLITQIVACEVVQNRTLNEGFPDTVRYVLLSGDFGGYDPSSKLYQHDKLIAEYVMRSWELMKTGDRSYRYTPHTGIYISYSADGRYCKVYDAEWRVVCDTSQFD